MEVTLPYTTNRVLNVEEAGGKLLPRWFGTANFVEVAPALKLHTGTEIPNFDFGRAW